MNFESIDSTPILSQSTKKRHLSSPIEQADLKKYKHTITLKATGETGLTEDMADMADDMAKVPQVAVTLTEEHLVQITEAVGSSLRSQISTIVSSIVDSVVKGLHSKISSLEEETQQLRSRVRSLEEKAEKSEQYSKLNRLRLSGILETADESVDVKVLEVAEAIGSDLVIKEIDRKHRLGRPKGSQGVGSPIIIKFASYTSRQKMMRNEAKLKQTVYLRAFLNENLTTTRDQIFYQARKMVKDKLIISTWTKDGIIIIKNARSKIHRVETQIDLDRVNSDVL